MKKEYIVDCYQDRPNIKEYMEEKLGFSSRQIKKLLKDRKISINKKIAFWDSKLTNNDTISVKIESYNVGYKPQQMELDIIFEDEYLLAVNKPSNLLVHSTPNNLDGTLANGISYYFDTKNEPTQIRFLNRLDMNTSGVVIIPKTAEAHKLLSKQMEDGHIKKYYLAVVEGVITPEKGEVKVAIDKDENNPIKRIVIKSGAPAETLYETKKVYKNASLVALQLITGRTHQARVHMSYLGHPILGDTLYGRESSLIARQALHAETITVFHPKTGEELVLTAKMPEDMKELIRKLEGAV